MNYNINIWLIRIIIIYIIATFYYFSMRFTYKTDLDKIIDKKFIKYKKKSNKIKFKIFLFGIIIGICILIYIKPFQNSNINNNSDIDLKI